MTESHLVKLLLLKATEQGRRLFRNNVGRLQDKLGRYVQFGLCPGSSDLVGWTPVTITQAHVGQTLAVFTAVEAKSQSGRPTVGQRLFLNAVQRSGGIAILARSLDDLPAQADK